MATNQPTKSAPPTQNRAEDFLRAWIFHSIHSSFELLYPNKVFRDIPKVDLLSTVRRSPPFKVGLSQKLSVIWVILRVLFISEIQYPGRLLPKACHIHLESLCCITRVHHWCTLGCNRFLLLNALRLKCELNMHC